MGELGVFGSHVRRRQSYRPFRMNLESKKDECENSITMTREGWLLVYFRSLIEGINIGLPRSSSSIVFLPDVLSHH